MYLILNLTVICNSIIFYIEVFLINFITIVKDAELLNYNIAAISLAGSEVFCKTSNSN